MSKRKPYYEYLLRTCMSLHECRECKSQIKLGQKYYDGGLDRRCHVDCACFAKEGTVDKKSLISVIETFLFRGSGHQFDFRHDAFDDIESRRAVVELVLDAIMDAGVAEIIYDMDVPTAPSLKEGSDEH